MSASYRVLRARQRGFSLIELMVGLLIGLMLSLALVVVLSTAEGRKRTVTSGNDMQQAGNYAMHMLDGWIRDAGSGFSKTASYSFGCELVAYYGNTKILPASAALPSPFDKVVAAVGSMRLAPVLILPGADQSFPGVSDSASDVLIIMGGGAGTGGVPATFSTFADATNLHLNSSYAVKANDLLLLSQVEPSATANYASDGSTISSLNAANCIVEQASSSYTSGSSTVPLSGNYHSTSNGVASLSDSSTASVIGNVSSNRPPQFMVVGVGDNNTLYSYDLLRTNGSNAVVPRADGVFELHALYGIDKDCDGTISNTEWINATDATYSLSALMAGSLQDKVKRPTSVSARKTACASLTTANDYLQKILAVRVGLILRTSLPEKDAVTTGAITLFSDLTDANGDPLTYTRALKVDADDSSRLEQHYRYRTMEFTIPLRNTLMLP